MTTNKAMKALRIAKSVVEAADEGEGCEANWQAAAAVIAAHLPDPTPFGNDLIGRTEAWIEKHLPDPQPKASCEHDWKYEGTDYHGSNKGEDSYTCQKRGCRAWQYRLGDVVTSEHDPGQRVPTQNETVSASQPVGDGLVDRLRWIESLLRYIQQQATRIAQLEAAAAQDRAAMQHVGQFNVEYLQRTAQLETELASLTAERNGLREALVERDRYAATCPIDKPRVSEADREQCSVCGATSGESCVRKSVADNRFIQAVRATLSKKGPSHEG